MDRVLDAARQLAQVAGGIDHVGPGTSSGAIVVKGTNQEREVTRPTITRAPVQHCCTITPNPYRVSPRRS